jgi:hypothetical protein
MAFQADNTHLRMDPTTHRTSLLLGDEIWVWSFTHDFLEKGMILRQETSKAVVVCRTRLLVMMGVWCVVYFFASFRRYRYQACYAFIALAARPAY